MCSFHGKQPISMHFVPKAPVLIVWIFSKDTTQSSRFSLYDQAPVRESAKKESEKSQKRLSDSENS
jgi:hypothetical protein